MIRRSVAGLILGISLLVGTVAWSGFVALRTVLDADRSRTVAQELVDNDQVRGQLVRSIGDALEAMVPEGAPIAPGIAAIAAEDVLNDPVVEQLLVDAFADTHAAFLGHGDAPESIDLSVVAASARDALITAAPELDGFVPAAPVLEVPLPTEHIPDAGPVRTFLKNAVPFLAILAGLGALIALVATSDRPAILSRAGVWAISTTLFFLILGLGVPWLLREYAPAGTEVLAALLTALLGSMLVPSIALGLVGLGLLGLSALWPERSRSRIARPIRESRRERRAGGVKAAAGTHSARRDAPLPHSIPEVSVPRPPGASTPVASPVQPVSFRAEPDVQVAAPTRDPLAGIAPPPLTETSTTSVAQRWARPADETAAMPATPGHADVSEQTDRSWHEGAVTASQPPRSSVYADAPSSAPPPASFGSTSYRAASDGAGPGSTASGPPPKWVEGHGWVLDPLDTREPPANAKWVEGVGHVVPGPPPDRPAGHGPN